MLLLYYFCAETWFAILFTVIVEIVNPEVKAISIAIFLFIMNNIGGNLPVIVAPIKDAIGYREAIYLVWPAMVGLSGILFFVASLPLYFRRNRNWCEPLFEAQLYLYLCNKTFLKAFKELGQNDLDFSGSVRLKLISVRALVQQAEIVLSVAD